MTSVITKVAGWLGREDKLLEPDFMRTVARLFYKKKYMSKKVAIIFMLFGKRKFLFHMV